MIELGHVDINCVTNCNLRCGNCSHAAPVNEPWSMTTEMLARDLGALRPIVHFHRLQMVGGEPTLHKNLVGLIEVARASGIAKDISVITNGKLLPRMTDDFWRAIDILQLSVYPVLDAAIVELAKAKCAEFGKPCYVTQFKEFHRQFRKTPNDGAHFRTCHWRKDCWSIHDSHFALCPQSLFFPKNFMGLDQFVDCLPLEGITEEKFSAFINRTEPLNACRICMANEMKSKPWGEAKREFWKEASTL